MNIAERMDQLIRDEKYIIEKDKKLKREDIELEKMRGGTIEDTASKDQEDSEHVDPDINKLG